MSQRKMTWLFFFQDEEGEAWYEKSHKLPLYYWIFQEAQGSLIYMRLYIDKKNKFLK